MSASVLGVRSKLESVSSTVGSVLIAWGCHYPRARRSGVGKTRVYVSFDFDHDEDLKVHLIGQAKHGDSPFWIADWSIKEAVGTDWKKK